MKTNTETVYRIETLIDGEWENWSGDRTLEGIGAGRLEITRAKNPGRQFRKVKVTTTTTEEVEVLE